jgi:hypothetical protein
VKGIKAFSAAMLLVSAAPCVAQEAAAAPAEKQANDGLDPTSPAKFVKPQFGLGGDRPANWGISAGIQPLSF